MTPRRPLAVIVVASFAVVVHAQTKSPIEGVWKVAEVQATGGEGTNAAPQPGYYIFTRGYYSIMAINGAKPRTVIPGGPGQPAPTDAQKIALYDHWAPFTANSGTYTIKGSTLSTKPLVAKNEGVMQGAGQTREFKVEGNTLWLIAKPAAGQPGAETRTKLTRVE
jgi:hypothetical protein